MADSKATPALTASKPTADATKTASDIVNSAATFSKDYFTKGGRFGLLSRAIFDLVLKRGKEYTIKQAQEKLKEYKEGI